MNMTWFEMTPKQKQISSFGRKMMTFSENGNQSIPLEILNAFSRVGEHLAEKATIKGLSDADKQVVHFAIKKLK
jgi:hypothetical protein